jgi:hypothetical protein
MGQGELVSQEGRRLARAGAEFNLAISNWHLAIGQKPSARKAQEDGSNLLLFTLVSPVILSGENGLACEPVHGVERPCVCVPRHCRRQNARSLGFARDDRMSVVPSPSRFRIFAGSTRLPACACCLHQTAIAPRSWLRMRMTSSTLDRKIFPSPILPVEAA